MKNKETDSEISALIKQTLEGYQEDYIQGSWENFVLKKKNKKRRIIWLISSGIAASIMVGILLFNLSNPVVKNDLLKNKQQAANKAIPDLFSTKKDTLTKLTAGLIPVKRKCSLKPIATSLYRMDLSGNHDAGTANTFYQTTNSPNDSVTITPNPKKTSDPAKGKTASKPIYFSPADDDQVVVAGSKRKVRFGVDFSPGINATQSASSFNFSGGITADIPVYSNFQFSTGLQLENQSIISNGPQISTSGPANQSKANLMNLDLPLNLTWRFFSNKLKCYYLSAGVSSLAYFKQDYQNTSYSQQLVAVSSLVGGHEIISYNIVNVASTTQNLVTPFRTFDFAGRLNFLLGLEQQLSPKLFLHFEPYLKIPVSGLATENLKYISSGVTFKISF